MDVGSPICSVVPSVDARVYEVLAGTTAPLSMRAVARRAGASVGAVQAVCRRLIAAGIVAEAPGGVVLNHEHIAAGPIIALARLRSTLVERMRSWVDDLDIAPQLVGLFGSTARGDGDASSDIDVVVVWEREGQSIGGELSGAVGRWTGNDVHVLEITLADVGRLRDAGESLLTTINEDLVVVSGESRAVAA